MRMKKPVVDMASLALGLNQGRKMAKPVLGELTVTENGVYDQPVIEGDKTITWDGVIGDKTCVYVDEAKTSAYVKVSDDVLSFNDFVGAVMTSGGTQFVITEDFLIDTPGVGVNCAALILSVRDADAFDAGFGLTFTEEGTYFNISFSSGTHIESLAFNAPTPADGWNKVTVNVASMELNIAYGDAAPEDTSKLWVKTAEPNGVVIGKGKHGSILAEKMPTPQSRPGCVKIDKKIYIFGGQAAQGSTNAATCFDAETERVVTLPNYPIAVASINAVPFGDKIYCFGGGDSKAIYVFDTKTSAYQRLNTDMTTTVCYAACGIVGTKVYLLGGYSGNVNSPKKSIYRYDIETDEYNILDIELPYTTATPISVTVGNKIYIFGGLYNGYNQSRKNAYCFDAETETISSIASMPEAFGSAGCVEIDGYIYIIGGVGYKSGNLYLDTVYRYDIKNNEYSLLETTISQPKCEMGCQEVNGKIYLFSGHLLNKNSDYYNNPEIELLTIPTQVKEGFLHLEIKEGATEVTVVSSDALTVKVPVFDVLLGNSVNVGESVEAAIYKGGAWKNI